jgi:transcription termination factor Rho
LNGNEILDDIKKELKTLSIYEVRQIARATGVAKPTDGRKEVLIDSIMRIASGREIPQPRSRRGAPIKSDMYNKDLFAKIQDCRNRCINDKNYLNSLINEENPPKSGVSESEVAENYVSGMAELYDGKWYLRERVGNNFSAKEIFIEDRYASYFKIKSGDVINVTTKCDGGENKTVVDRVISVNGEVASSDTERMEFDALPISYPEKVLHVASSEADFFGRSVDFVAPIAVGQRVAVLAPVGMDKGRAVREIATKIAFNNPDLYFSVILADCASEEVIEYEEGIKNAELFSVSDNLSQDGLRCANLALEYAKRKVEDGKDVVLVIDDVTKLARAFNMCGSQVVSSLETFSLIKIKQYLNSAKNVTAGGSLTVMCAVDMDERDTFEGVLYSYLYNLFSVRIVLSKKLALSHIYPPIDIRNSGSKREERYMSQKALDALISLRKKSFDGDDTRLNTLLRSCGADDELYTTLIEDCD